MSIPNTPAEEILLEWDDSAGKLTPSVQPAIDPTIIDSWLVDGGRTRGLARHIDRFSTSCYEISGPQQSTVRSFMTAALAVVPLKGRWFPRVELRPSCPNMLAIRVRPAPAISTSARVWIVDHNLSDRTPHLKGPDLAMLGMLRQEAHSVGADEAILLGPDGRILEGAANSIMWWRGNVLCTTPPDGQVLPGITRKWILELARARGETIRYESAPPSGPAGLDGLETWLTNALHGIRPVTEWIGSQIQPGQPLHAPSWSRELANLALPIDQTVF